MDIPKFDVKFLGGSMTGMVDITQNKSYRELQQEMKAINYEYSI